jgi:hypothetical protein
MSDPVLALILLVSFFAAVSAAAWFRTLDGRLWADARIPLVAGVVSGLLIHFARLVPPFLSIGAVLTLAALYVRLMGRESEPSDGMMLGAITGAAAAAPLVVLAGQDELLLFSQCILASAVSGYGITFGLTHVREKGRQAAIDAVTAALAVGTAWAAGALVRAGTVSERNVAAGAAALIPLLGVLTVFKQWPSVREELRQEAVLGFIDEEDVRLTAHPLLRLGRAGWHDAEAHREFVRIATRMALRKRQQRSRADDTVRLYQLEVIKLRMQMQEMGAIDRRMRAAATGQLST